MRVGSLCARSAEIRVAKRLYMVAIWPQIEQPRAIERDSRCLLAPLHTHSVHRIGLPMNFSSSWATSRTECDLLPRYKEVARLAHLSRLQRCGCCSLLLLVLFMSTKRVVAGLEL